MVLNRFNRFDIAQTIVLVLLSSFLIFTFFFNIDITDEGFYLYYFQWGHEAPSFNFYHVLISPIGALFDHTVLGYRFFALILILASAWLLSRKTESVFWSAPLLFGLLYYQLPATFSYNSMALVGLSSVLGLAINTFEAKRFYSNALLIGLFSFLVFSARYGAGFLAAMLVMFAFMLTAPSAKKLKFLICVSCSFAICCLILVLLWPDGLRDTLANVNAIKLSSHSNIFGRLLNDGLAFVGKAILIPLAVFFLTDKFLPSVSRIVRIMFFSRALILYFLFQNDFRSFSYYFSGMIMADIVIRLLHERDFLDRKSVYYLYLPSLFFLISSLGTNANPFKGSSSNILLLYPAVNALYFQKMKRHNQIISYLTLVIVVFAIIFKHQYLQTYRSPPREKQEFVSSELSMLKGIKIDKIREDELLRARDLLASEGFDFKKDLVLGFANIPGVIAYNRLRAFGVPWYFVDYAGIEKTNCAYVQHYAKTERKIFVLADRELPKSLLNCLNEASLSPRFIQMKISSNR